MYPQSTLHTSGKKKHKHLGVPAMFVQACCIPSNLPLAANMHFSFLPTNVFTAGLLISGTPTLIQTFSFRNGSFNNDT